MEQRCKCQPPCSYIGTVIPSHTHTEHHESHEIGPRHSKDVAVGGAPPRVDKLSLKTINDYP